MQLVATYNNVFFRAQTVSEDILEMTKQGMLKDQKDLEFQIMTDNELEKWLLNYSS